MKREIRKLGINIIGDVPWGFHLCQFYQTKEDLINILVPYFKAGLENNEFCMWVTSEPLNVEDAKSALKKVVYNLEDYIKKEQIEIIPHTEWYLKDGDFDLQRVLNSWVDKLNQALAKGYDGMRVTGNTAWLEKKDWENFKNYEEKVNNVVDKYKMLAICTYSLDKCGVSEVIDVVSNHQFALIRKEGKWEAAENSEHKRVEDELYERASIIDVMIDCLLVTNIDGTIAFMNRAMEKIVADFDVDPKTLIGKPFFALPLFRSEVRNEEKVAKSFKQIILGGGITFPEMCDAAGCWWSINITPIKDNKGNPKSLLGIARDITERKRAEEQLKQAKEYIDNIIVSMIDALIVVDSNGNTMIVNKSTKELLGYRDEELIGQPVGIVFEEEEEEEEEEFTSRDIKRIVKYGFIKNYNAKLKSKRGEIIPVSINASVMRSKANKINGIVIVARDIREVNRIQSQLIQSEKMAAIGQLGAKVAHEINNPLGSILGFTQLMLGEFSEDDTKYKDLKRIEAAAVRCKKTIESLLDFARPAPFEAEPININKAIEDTLFLFDQEIKTVKNIKIFSDLQDSLPSVSGNENQLQQVFFNMLKNAKQALPQSQSQGKIHIKTKLDFRKKNVKISIKDNGIGITKQDLPKIFDPFYTSKKSPESSGLGLSVCKRIIEMHKGRIEVKSKPNKGSSFTIKLPI